MSSIVIPDVLSGIRAHSAAGLNVYRPTTWVVARVVVT